ncbi:MAG: hypothetical protein AAF750_17565 [Planctomycetota bacterium]
MPRHILASLIVAALLTAAAPLHAEELRITSWNLDLHGNPNLKPYRTPAPNDLARILNHIQPDILVVQEARPDFGPTNNPPRNRTLRDALKQLPGRWDHALLPADDPSGFMRTGVAWNRDKLKLNNGPIGTKLRVRHARVPGSDLRTWLRHPYGFHFAVRGNQTDFLLIPAHLKAEHGNNDYTRFRHQEATELAAALPRLTKQLDEQDVIVMGRLNSTHSEPATQAFASANLTDANPDDQPALLALDRKARQVVPHFAPTRAFLANNQPELANPRFTVTPLDTMANLGFSPAYYYQRISDYLPATITLTIQPDDD